MSQRDFIENQNLQPIEADRDPYQKANTGRQPVDVIARPAPITANDLVQPSENPLTIVSEMVAGGDAIKDHALYSQWQQITPQASGDLVAGGFSGGNNRTPTIRGLP